MTYEPGIFTLCWQLLKRVPDLYNLLMSYLAPLIGSGGIITQIIWCVVLCKYFPPFIESLIDRFPTIWNGILDFFDD